MTFILSVIFQLYQFLFFPTSINLILTLILYFWILSLFVFSTFLASCFIFSYIIFILQIFLSQVQCSRHCPECFMNISSFFYDKSYLATQPADLTIRLWWKKLKMTQTDGKIYHIQGLVELILLKWSHYPRQSTDSLQSLSKYQWHFSQS